MRKRKIQRRITRLKKRRILNKKEKRTWVYTQMPKDYGMAPCACGNHETQWSEFKGHLWCDKCNIDFKPEHGGVFDGSIPFYTSALLGMQFDHLNLETGKIERFNPETNEYTVQESAL